MLFQNFMTWVQKSSALVGFEPTEEQIKIVFSDLDPHKKGYLTERDWILAFSNRSPPIAPG